MCGASHKNFGAHPTLLFFPFPIYWDSNSAWPKQTRWYPTSWRNPSFSFLAEQVPVGPTLEAVDLKFGNLSHGRASYSSRLLPFVLPRETFTICLLTCCTSQLSAQSAVSTRMAKRSYRVPPATVNCHPIPWVFFPWRARLSALPVLRPRCLQLLLLENHIPRHDFTSI